MPPPIHDCKYSNKLAYNVALAMTLILIAGGSYVAITKVTQENSPFTLVGGTSMQPTIMTGTFAIVSKVPFNQLKVGDVIVFKPQITEDAPCVHSTQGSLAYETSVPCRVIHRIVAIDESGNNRIYVTTKGDNNQISIQYYDTNISQSMYVGKVILQIPLLGYLTEYPYNKMVVVILLVYLAIQVLWEVKLYEKRRISNLPQEIVQTPLILSSDSKQMRDQV